MANNTNIIEVIHRRKLMTVSEHDQAMEEVIATGSAVEEPEPEIHKVIFSGIGCAKCASEMFDARETKTDPDNKKYRRCYCFRCGNRAWRRTP